MHYSRTHKFHFLATFLLKMGPTVLFTHLKIILLQYFSVFSFQLYPNGPLGYVWVRRLRYSVLFFFFSRVLGQILLLRLLFMHYT